MKTARKSGFAVGSTVALTEEYLSLFESVDLRNVICKVVDVRLLSGCYVYRVAPVGEFGPQLARVVEAYADDLRAVRS